MVVVKGEACVWNLCLRKANDAVLDVQLLFGGKTYTKKRVPLCTEHLHEFGRSRRMNLSPAFLFEVEARR